MFKKITSVLAAVAMTLAGLGTLPAQAVNYVPNTGSNIIQSNWISTTGTSAVIAIPTSNAQNVSFRRGWTFSGTNVDQVKGKLITVSYTLTAPDGSTPSSGSSYASISGNLGNSGNGNNTYFNENNQGSGFTMTPVSGNTYNYATVTLYFNLYSSMTALQVGNYTLSNLKVKADGTELVMAGLSTDTNASYINNNEVTVNSNWGLGTSAAVSFGSGAYEKFKASTTTCLNTSLVSEGDVITVRHLTDGVVTPDGSDEINRNVAANLGTADYGNYVWMNNDELTLTAEHVTKNLKFRGYAEYYNSANTSDSRVNANNSISVGTHTFGVSVTKADGTEVSGPCTPAVPSAPSAPTQSGSNISVNGTGTFADGFSYYCQGYNSSTNTPVGNEGYASTSGSYSNGAYSSLTCSLYNIPGGTTIYAKFIAKSRDYTSWTSASTASPTLTLAATGFTVNSTASNGTAWGTVKALPLMDGPAIPGGDSSQPFVETFAEPTGGIFEFTAGGDENTQTIGVRRITSNGLDSTFGLKTISLPAMSMMPTSGWHGTAAAPRPVSGALEGMANSTLVLTDLTTTGATGLTRTVSNAQLTALCVGAAGAGYILSSVKIISAPTSDVWFSANCVKSGAGSSLQSYIIAKVSLSGSGAPTLVTQVNAPDSAFPRIYTVMGMYGSTLPVSVNPTATGSSPMITVLALPQASNMMSYGTGKIIRITSGGSVSSTDMSLTIPSGTTVSTLSPSTYNLGDIVVTVRLMAMGPSTTSYLKIGATGADSAFTPNWDTDADLSNASSSVSSIIGKTSTGETVFMRRGSVTAPSGSYSLRFKLAKINFATGAVTTFGELMDTVYTSGATSYVLPVGTNGAAFVSQSAATTGKWNVLVVNGQSNTPAPPAPVVPVPTQTSNSNLGIGLNAGGNKIEITGTLLTAITGITFNGVALPAGKFVKTATKVTITVPAGTTGIVPVALVHAGGTIPVGNYEYIGATKVTQNIAISAGSEIFSVGDADRVLAPTSTYDDDADANTAQVTTGLTVTIVSKSPAICTVSQNLLRFVASGTCTIEGTQAGDARFAAGQKVTKVFYVEPTYTGASALYSTDGGKPTITLTGTGLTSVTAVKLGNQVVTDVKSNSTGTLLTVKIPVADSANAAANTADLKLVYGNPANPVIVDTQDDFTFVGGTKVNQTIAFTTSASATYGDAVRTLTASSTDPNSNALDVVVTFKSTTSTVCSVIGNELRFLIAGTCTVVASQAGNAGVNKATDVTVTITVAKKAQVITINDTTLELTDVDVIASGVDLDSHVEMDIEFVSSNEDICTVDGDGMISGVSAGTCTITVSQAGDARYLAATSTDGFTVTAVVSTSQTPVVDAADAEGDGSTPAVAIGTGGLNTFTSTNDAGFQLAWDKASGKLIPRATGVYTGFIQAKLTFTKAGVTYTCTNVFGSNAAMKNKKPAEKKAAKAVKTFTTKAAFCTDANTISPTVLTAVLAGGLTPANFAKIKPSAKDAKAAATVVGSRKYEAVAFAALKNFTGTVSIEIKRFRAWPTTGVNITGDKKNGKKIPLTTRNTSVTLQ